VASAATSLTANAKRRLERGEAMRVRSVPLDRRASELRLDELLRAAA